MALKLTSVVAALLVVTFLLNYTNGEYPPVALLGVFVSIIYLYVFICTVSGECNSRPIIELERM